MPKQPKRPPARGRPAVVRSETFTQRAGALIRARREALKLTGDEAAAKAGVPRATWYHFEAGRHLRLERLPQIAKALRCKVRALIPDE